MLLLIAGFAFKSEADVIYFNDFNSPSSLNGYTIGELGTGQVSLDNGQLRLDPGVYYFDRAYAAFNASQLPGYNPKLSFNSAMVTWAFNISNMDGQYNNHFRFNIYSTPDMFDSAGYGYNFEAGGMVGDRMFLVNRTAPYGNIGDIMVDTPNGLSVMPEIGAVRITFEPNLNRWSLYFAQSISMIDPLTVNTLIGTSTNSRFTYNLLPWISFLSQDTGSLFIDNFSISVVPEPSSIALILVGILLLARRRLPAVELKHDTVV